MPNTKSDLAQDYLIRGNQYLAQFPGFELVGRDDVLKKLTAILMRKSANSVLLLGAGGVGCSAICIGLQASKDKPDTPFDIVSKRFFWLDSDLLFASGDHSKINSSFDKTLRTLAKTPNAVLVMEDMRDFIDAARNNGCTNLINAMMHSVKKKKFQAILEARDEDLEAVLSCHSDMKEGYTLLDINEPDDELLSDIVKTIAGTRLKAHHKIKISNKAVETAIEVTNKYRVRDMGLSRAQPERSLTLLDRALTSYRLDAHAKDPRIQQLTTQLELIKSQLPEAANGEELKQQTQKINNEISQLNQAWAERQTQIKKIYAELRDGEEAIRSLENDIEEQQAEEARLQQQDEDVEVENNNKKGFVSFASRAALGGYDSEEVAAFKKQIKKFQAEVAKHRKHSKKN